MDNQSRRIAHRAIDTGRAAPGASAKEGHRALPSSCTRRAAPWWWNSTATITGAAAE